MIRGNFRTRESVIRDELKLREGGVLTDAALVDGQRRLRSTGLFDAVNVELPSLCTTPDPACIAANGEINAVVVVQERYDYFFQIETSVGYSSYSGAFFTIAPSQKNILGLGISLTASYTEGDKITDYEATLGIPRWLMRRVSPVDFDGLITAFDREQLTPNFGALNTEGVTVSGTRTFAQIKTPEHPARAFALSAHYDFRIRQRNVDALRPIGIDNDQTQVPVSTTTGSVGVSFDWDQRLDRQGGLSSLSPEDGFRFDANASYASHYLGGQDDFFKVSATGTRYWPLGENFVLRADLRYDQGFPLGNAVLLPEVERFFAGGDSTVRGYDDDKLATELVQVGVPPLMNVTQLRVLAAGGNIRVMGSLDAQLRIWRFFASGLFSDAGMITNEWGTVTVHDVRPSIGMALLRVITPFGVGALEYAVPLQPQLGDDPRGRWHISLAARAQF